VLTPPAIINLSVSPTSVPGSNATIATTPHIAATDVVDARHDQQVGVGSDFVEWIDLNAPQPVEHGREFLAPCGRACA
jgi:hypothetical protein